MRLWSMRSSSAACRLRLWASAHARGCRPWISSSWEVVCMPPAVCVLRVFPPVAVALTGSPVPLATGADGHCASLYPHSPQVLVSPSSRLVVEAAGKGGTTFTLDLIRSARHVIISAPKPAQKEMVKMALAREDAAGNAGCPAGMISAGAGTSVEWLLSPESAALLPDVGTA